ncbi:hypothetical protein ETD86_51465 [Nonomuraea turkmeniaca]|uniref:DUF4352 domain-containing protein n=1 Tax=Nonomuraea turkmeniaca TaxID=103838 RepID=A0A5S4EVL0_9ACTN|nr:hypothetical protein [Nonomuraea turkmeniaca]TMR07585.1 hypothetical protein ETD86_51465 [Nonomuraea turkmeniaca]
MAMVALTGIGITALLGGLGEAPEEPDALGPGSVLDQGRYSTKFVESRVKVEEGKFDFDQDKRFVELVFEVTNKGDETAPVGLPPKKIEQAFTATSFAGSLVKITPAFTEEAGPFAFGLSKGGETRQLQPDVPTQVILRYRLKDNENPPEKITLDVAAFEFEPDFLSDTPQWGMVSKEVGDKRMPEVKARVTLSVKGGAGA